MQTAPSEAFGPGPPTRDAAEEVDLTGRTLGDFHILRKLGVGGMGQVYLAEQLSLKRKVALKTLKASLASNSTARLRFKSEAENVARATHANIVQVYATGEFDGVPYIALEYVEGRNLRDYLARKGPPDLRVALSIMRQVAAALQRASELGLIHRDVKPDNILLTRKGEAKVTDFGLARVLTDDQPAVNLTASGMTMGTPLYMAPEQVEGKSVDCRTDIYSFGVTCYHLLAGQPPYSGNSAFEVALQHVRGEPVPLGTVRPDLPEALVAIVHKMMAKEPAQRYQTCREIQRDLARVRDSLSGVTAIEPFDEPSGEAAAVTMGPRPAGTQPVPPPGRPRWMLFAFTLVVAAVGGVALAWWQTRPPELPAVLPSPVEPEEDASLHKDEQTLRDATRRYLNQGTSPKTVARGFILALDLGLLYLEHGKIDEAQALFSELEAHKTVKSYQVLGQFGKAVVQALRATSLEDAKQSTAVLRELFDAAWRELYQRTSPRRNDPEIAMWTEPGVRYWTSQALWYNTKNGVPPREFTTMLARLRDAPGRP